MSQINLSNSWLQYLKEEFNLDYMRALNKFLEQEYKKSISIFPTQNNYFRALDLVPIEKVRVVILGQDPYHGEGQAHGLAFSVQDGVKHPPSLKNIFKELKSDLEIETPLSGDLSHWAQQGVLLLNSVLTVEKDKAASHQNQGWEKLTDKIISVINENTEGVVFILWGSYAQKKAQFVDHQKHLVLESAHPSPLSSYRGFFSSKPFSKTNDWLSQKNKPVIKW